MLLLCMLLLAVYWYPPVNRVGVATRNAAADISNPLCTELYDTAVHNIPRRSLVAQLVSHSQQMRLPKVGVFLLAVLFCSTKTAQQQQHQ